MLALLSSIASAQDTIIPFKVNIPGFVEATPLVDGGMLYVGSENFKFYAVDLVSRSVLWEFTTGARIVSTPTLRPPRSSNEEKLVVFTSRDGSCYAVFANNGTQRWRKTTSFFLDSSPLYDSIRDAIVFGGTSDFSVYALDAWTGQERWRFRTPTAENGRFLAGPKLITGSASDASNDRIAIGTTNAHFYLMSANTGVMIWSTRTLCNTYAQASYCGTPNNLVVFGCGRSLLGLNLHDGTTAFDFSADGDIRMIPRVVGSQIIFASNDGLLHSVRCSARGTNPTELWSANIGGLIAGPMANNLANDLVIATNSQGKVYGFRPADGFMEFVFEQQDGPIYGSAVESQPPLPASHVIFAARFQEIYIMNVTAAVAVGNGRGYGTTPIGEERGGALTIALAVGIPCMAVLLVITGIVWWQWHKKSRQDRLEEQQRRADEQAAFDAARALRNREQEEMRIRQRVHNGGENNRGNRRHHEAEQEVSPAGLYGSAEAPPPYPTLVVPSPESREGSGRSPLARSPVPAVPQAELRDEQEELQLWENNQKLTKAVLNESPSVQLPWAYVRRLTKDFSEPLQHKNPLTNDGKGSSKGSSRSGGSAEFETTLYHASEFIDGILHHLVVKVFLSSARRGEELPHELALISRLRHRNIIPIYGWSSDTTPDGCVRYATIMKYIPGGNITDLLRQRNTAVALNASCRLYIALGVAYGLKDMNSKGIYHRDVKGHNVLLDSEGDGVLIDFDVACEAPGIDAEGAPRPMQMTARKRIFGTPGYICPDYARLMCGYGESQEVYSYCIFLAELLTGQQSSPENDLGDATHPLDPDPRLPSFPQHRVVAALVRAGAHPGHRNRPTMNGVISELKKCIRTLQKAPNSDFLEDAEALKRSAVPRPPALSGIQLDCSICGEPNPEAARRKGVECSAAVRHFVCDECVNNRIAAMLDAGESAEAMSLSCPMPGCHGRWFFTAFAACLDPSNFRRWHTESTKAAQQRGHQQASEHYSNLLASGGNQYKELEKHCAAIRVILRPTCPHCGLQFQSFSGCLSVSCGVKTRQGRQLQGCGSKFCGACLVPSPCPAGHGHGFMSNQELHSAWKGWRRMKARQYLNSHLGDNSDLMQAAVESLRSEFEACGIYPL